MAYSILNLTRSKVLDQCQPIPNCVYNTYILITLTHKKNELKKIYKLKKIKLRTRLVNIEEFFPRSPRSNIFSKRFYEESSRFGK